MAADAGKRAPASAGPTAAGARLSAVDTSLDAAPVRPDHPYSDTQVDGDVTVDSAGHFQPDQKALRVFDYFFIDSGRLSDAEIQQQIHDWLVSRLQQPALSEALAFLDQYLALRQSAADAYSAGEMTEDPLQRLQLIRRLQEQAFGRELAAHLFGDEYRRQLARVEHMQALASGEQADPLQGLSAAEARAYQRTRSVLAAGSMAEDAEDAEQLWQRRSEAYGYDAAYRLAELDQRRSEWDARVADYQLEKQLIENDTSLSESDRARLNQQLLDQHFLSTEQARVRALARISTAEAQAR